MMFGPLTPEDVVYGLHVAWVRLWVFLQITKVIGQAVLWGLARPIVLALFLRFPASSEETEPDGTHRQIFVHRGRRAASILRRYAVTRRDGDMLCILSHRLRCCDGLYRALRCYRFECTEPDEYVRCGELIDRIFFDPLRPMAPFEEWFPDVKRITDLDGGW
jgi:hypothetical protein